MKINDKVYGEVEISEPVLIEIINSPTFQRLKDIDQVGYFEPYFPGTSRSRLEHSLGVCLLLRKYNAPIEEQIAGLIHDVSHSAFSHCIDYVLKGGSEKEHTYQDNIFEKFVKKSDLPIIFSKNDIDLEYILNDENFPLKEKDLPDLCADRLDYSLRDALSYGKINTKDAEYFLDNLITKDGNWIFKNYESARKYADLFLELNTVYYAGLITAVMFLTVREYLRYALFKRYINETDLYTTDKEVLEKIKLQHDKDEHLKLLFDRMNNKISYKNDPLDFEGEIYCKSRIVDPLCEEEGIIKKVSEIDKNWNLVLEKESKPKHYFIKFEK